MVKKRRVGSAGAVLAAMALCSLVVAPCFAQAADAPAASEKDETVYVYANPDGSVKNAEVETVLKNPDGAAELLDSSTLTGIEGKGDVAHTGSGDSIVWAAGGENVTYTGTTSAAAPVSMSVTYMLDGQEVSPSQIAGKSGHVAIRYDFTNHSEATATVSGVNRTIYTPFTCITAIMLDGKDFKNVKVENGKVINDGDDMIVAGYAMPGLKESLGSMADDADVPEHFTVEADAANFELKSTMTIVTAGLMSEFNADSLGIRPVDGASALTDAMGQLINGSEQLANGLDALASNMKDLEAGATGIQGGAATLSGGLSALAGDSGLGYLSGSAYTIASAIGTVGEGVSGMKEKLSEAAKGLAEATEASEAFSGAAAVMAANADKIVGEGKMSEADYQTVMAALAAASGMGTAVGEVAGQLSEAGAELDKFTGQVAELKASAEAVAGGVYTASSTAAELAGGAASLEEYATQLSQAVPALAQGVESAADGSKTLTQGMRTFNDQGVSQLVYTLQSDYGGMLDRMNALSDAAKSYTNFAGITPGTTGSVKFVFETDAIAKE